MRSVAALSSMTVLFMLLSYAPCRSQGISFKFPDAIDLEGMAGQEQLFLYQWYRQRSLRDGVLYTTHIMYFSQDREGVDSATAMVREICKGNGLDYYKPSKDDSSPSLRNASEEADHVEEILAGTIFLSRTWVRTIGKERPVRGYLVFELREKRFSVMVVSQ